YLIQAYGDLGFWTWGPVFTLASYAVVGKRSLDGFLPGSPGRRGVGLSCERNPYRRDPWPDRESGSADGGVRHHRPGIRGVAPGPRVLRGWPEGRRVRRRPEEGPGDRTGRGVHQAHRARAGRAGQ